MALLGFDKAKVLHAAEKYVLQGKIQAAIDEYNKILKKDPKDLMTLNTIGDLYDRAGKKDEAIKCFYTLAEKYVESSAIPRSIAVYKRITKLDPEAIAPLLKLGELYSMQGLLRDARTHYLQAVELHMRRQEKDKAREIFEKVLLLDLENPRLQLRMAELYAETGKKEEAIATYLSTVERFLDRNEPAEATRALEALLKLAPENIDAKVLYGRLCVEQGDPARAIQALQSIPSPAGHKGVLNWLFLAYMKQGDVGRARDLAVQLFDLHEDFAGLAQVCEQLVAGGDVEEALAIYQKGAERLVAQNSHSALVEGLQKILASQPSHPGALELLWQVHRQAGNRGEAQEIGELLAHMYVTNGELEKAHAICSELVEIAPESAELAQLLRQVNTRLGRAGATPEAAAEPVPAMAAELGLGREGFPAAEETLAPREQDIVRNALTESDLYTTYRQFSHAIDVLEKGLAEVPGNISLQEQLLRLYEQAGQYEKAAACAEALTQAYVMLGDGDRATQYGELTLSFQQKASHVESPVPETAPVEAEPPAPLPAGLERAPEAAPAGESSVREVDLSLEWAALSGVETTPAAPAAAERVAESAADSVAEEIEFYLQAGLASEAVATLERLRGQSPSHPSLAEFEARLAALQGGEAPAAVIEEAVPPAEMVEPAGTLPGRAEPPQAEVTPPAGLPGWPAAPPPAAAEPELDWDHVLTPPTSGAGHSGFELSLEEVQAPRPPAAHAAEPPPDRFAALAGELSEMLGEPSPPVPSRPAGAPSPAPPVPAAASAAPPKGSLLDDVFAEFKEEMEEPAAAGDIETHYNMGIAFKEMALYDEAIGEFQKAHQLSEKAKDTSHLVQCCSLLATCFLEKGLPLLAVKWYQTALHAPGLDSETSLALLYEIGSAYEVAGDRAAALKSFLEVYAHNIDYRNVSDRIRDLQQSQ